MAIDRWFEFKLADGREVKVPSAGDEGWETAARRYLRDRNPTGEIVAWQGPMTTNFITYGGVPQAAPVNAPA